MDSPRALSNSSKPKSSFLIEDILFHRPKVSCIGQNVDHFHLFQYLILSLSMIFSFFFYWFKSFGDLAVGKEMLFNREPATENRCYDMFSAGNGSGFNSNSRSMANLHGPSDYAFFPNALAAAFLCPTPSTSYNFNAQRSNKGDGQHPSPLFFQTTGCFHEKKKYRFA